MYTDETKRAELFVGLKYDPSQNYLTAHLSRPGRAGDALDDYDAAKPAEMRRFADDLTAALLSSVGFRESDTHAALKAGQDKTELVALRKLARTLLNALDAEGYELCTQARRELRAEVR